MRIVSLNVWHGRQVSELRELLIGQIDSTDIFCFQEADGDSIEAICRDLLPPDTFHEIRCAKDRIDDSPDVVATFVRRNGVEVRDSTALLNDTGDDTGCCVLVQLRYQDQDLLVANVHGMARPGDKLDTPGRLLQSRTIIDALSDYDGIKVACGDFNLQPDTESVKLFERAGYVNLIANYRIETTRNELVWNRYPDSKQLFADYSFVSPSTAAQDFSVPRSLASDHLPMILDINLAEQS